MVAVWSATVVTALSWPALAVTAAALLLCHVATLVSSVVVPPTVVAEAERVKVSPAGLGGVPGPAALRMTAVGVTEIVAVELLETKKSEQEVHNRKTGSNGSKQTRRRNRYIVPPE